MRVLSGGKKRMLFSTLAFDGTARLAAGGGCNPTHVWDVASGELVARLDEHKISFELQSLAFRKGQLLVPTKDGLAAQRCLSEAFTAPPPGLELLGEDDQETLLRIAVFLADHAETDLAASIGIDPQRRD